MIAALIARNVLLRAACAQARHELAAAYGDTPTRTVATCEPLEQPSAAFVAARDAAEARTGVRVWKHFMDREG